LGDGPLPRSGRGCQEQGGDGSIPCKGIFMQTNNIIHENNLLRLMLWNSMSEEQKYAARADVFQKYELRGYDPKDESHDLVVAFLFFRMALTN
jgi:hypothetical protein